MMKPTVVHFLPTFDMGGLGSLALTMIRAWPDKGVRHITIAPSYAGTKPTLLPEFWKLIGDGSVAEVPRDFQRSPIIYRDELAAKLRSLTIGPYVTHAINYNFSDHVWNVQAFRMCGYPQAKFICHVGTVLDDSHETKLRLHSVHARNTIFVPASKAVANRIHLLMREKINDVSGIGDIHPVVWNGVDVAKFEKARQEAPPPTAPMIFGFTGRMADPAVKDWDTLIGGFARMETDEAELRIAGDGPLKSVIAEKLRNACTVGVFKNFSMPGNIMPEKIPAFLADLDCFVMAALPIEGFSMALVEAIASGCLLLGTDVPSVRETFEAADGTEFLARNAVEMGKLMTAFGRRGVPDEVARQTRFRNYMMGQKLKSMVSAERMAAAYYAIR